MRALPAPGAGSPSGPGNTSSPPWEKWLAICLLLALGLAGCHPPPPAAERAVAPSIQDDADIASLRQALAATRRYWQSQEAGREITACGQRFSVRDYLAALDRLDARLASTPTPDLTAAVAQDFALCPQPASPNPDGLLVTGYYQPRFSARWRPQPPFVHPLYRLPPDLVPALVFDSQGEHRAVGRIEDGRIVPYFSRAEIENRHLLKGQELCYLASPVEVFILQVQGSGLLTFADGERRQVLFAGTNGRPYRSIGRLLADEGRIPLAEVTMPRLLRYLKEHVDDQRRILQYNQRYVFFRLAPAKPSGGGPVGSMDAPLTPGRSVALDPAYFPLGGLYLLASERPVAGADGQIAWRPLRRLVLNQDTGAAIRGPARLDLFWGSGDYPELAAGLMKQRGQLYQLVPRPPNG